MLYSKKIFLSISLVIVFLLIIILNYKTPISFNSISSKKLQESPPIKITILKSIENISTSIEDPNEITSFINTLSTFSMIKWDTPPSINLISNEVYYIKIYLKDTSFIGLRLDDTNFIDIFLDGTTSTYKILNKEVHYKNIKQYFKFI